ncbi:class I adenylate-forming enzyme family protein [Salinibacillus xinjiangensis]|uniref:AMP-binding protein n=1 Tax=Salinibacillus xinjiangensis TaxID=1229268 RepID=A0A6G1X205_9BACI|nr:AMP-binding protein [Salinibacillus xinjiangensis]MRG84969.1 AMP-binding protein [Salinibacillus xinjiangensis]
MLITGNKNVYDLIIEKSTLHPKKVFLYYEDQVITYDELRTRVNQTADFLKTKGVEKGDKVAVLLSNRPEFYDLWFGCGAIGAVMVPINTASTAFEIEYFVDHSDAVGFIAEDSLFTNEITEVVDSKDLAFQEVLDEEWGIYLQKYSSENREEDVQPSDVCGMMYTSGTTSKPKGVEITHENYLFAGETSVRNQWLTPFDRYLIFLPLFHVNSQYYTSMASLVVGCSIVLKKRFSSSTFWDDVQRYQPTVSSFVATTVKMLLQTDPHPNEKDHTLKWAGYGLFVTYNELEEFEARFGVRLYQWFGMTESITTNIVTPLFDKRIRDERTGIVPIGKPALGHEVKIVDEEGKELGPDQVGQIVVKSPSLMKGYYKNPEATQETLKDGWLYTGDSGYYLNNGYIWFVDRSKDMIKRAGENISSIEVENTIRVHPSVEDCAVISVPDHLREEAVAAYIKVLDGESLTEEEIKSFCEKRLSYFKVPQIYQFVEDFPRTSIGKIQKNHLRDHT